MTNHHDSYPAAFIQWIEPGGFGLEEWLDDDFLPHVRSAQGVRAVARHADPDQPGSSMVLAWFDDAAAARAAVDDRAPELQERGAGRLGPGGGIFTCRSAFGETSAVQEAPAAAGGILTARLRVMDGAADDARRWLDGEHAPRQLTVEGALSYHGLEPLDRDRDRLFVNLWGLQSPAIADGEAWGAMRDTPWRTEFWQNVESVTRGLFRTGD